MQTTISNYYNAILNSVKTKSNLNSIKLVTWIKENLMQPMTELNRIDANLLSEALIDYFKNKQSLNIQELKELLSNHSSERMKGLANLFSYEKTTDNLFQVSGSVYYENTFLETFKSSVPTFISHIMQIIAWVAYEFFSIIKLFILLPFALVIFFPVIEFLLWDFPGAGASSSLSTLAEPINERFLFVSEIWSTHSSDALSLIAIVVMFKFAFKAMRGEWPGS